MKTCISCKQTKPLENFGRQPGGLDGRINQCNECINAKQRERRALKRLSIWGIRPFSAPCKLDGKYR